MKITRELCEAIINEYLLGGAHTAGQENPNNTKKPSNSKDPLQDPSERRDTAVYVQDAHSAPKGRRFSLISQEAREMHDVIDSGDYPEGDPELENLKGRSYHFDKAAKGMLKMSVGNTNGTTWSREADQIMRKKLR